MRQASALCLAACLALIPASSIAATLKQLVHQAPDGAIITMLMTDGTVLAQGFTEQDWWKLTPDSFGSYVNGTWTQVANLPANYSPYAMAESVLADGRLVIAGGEYNFDTFAFTNQSAIYDPIANTWTDITPTDKNGPAFIGDSPASVLPDGRFAVGEKFTKRVYVFDPNSMAWSELVSRHKHDFNAEEGWALLPDGSILTFDVLDHPQSERYLPDKGKWVDAGSTIVDLRGPQDCCGNCIPYGPKNKCYDPPGEVGGSVLRPDGTVFAAGSLPEGETVAHTSIYSPPSKGDPSGHWTPGPDFPQGKDSFDAPVTILPSGMVLIEASDGTLYESDGTTMTRTGSAGGNLMNLPTGEVLIGGFEVYQPDGHPQKSWAPKIDTVPTSLTRGQTYQVTGKQFNGLSQGAALGDEFDSHTNYPLVRITINSTNHVFYARTHDHSTMGVATRKLPVSTNFDVPAGMETGAGKLEVVANGIASKAVAVTVN